MPADLPNGFSQRSADWWLPDVAHDSEAPAMKRNRKFVDSLLEEDGFELLVRGHTCSHLTWRGQSSRPPAVSPSRVRPTAVSALAQCAAPPIRHFPLRRPDGGRDRRWDHPAVRPWRRRPVRRPHGTRAYQPERRWGPPVRDRALSGLASSHGLSTRWRRTMI